MIGIDACHRRLEIPGRVFLIFLRNEEPHKFSVAHPALSLHQISPEDGDERWGIDDRVNGTKKAGLYSGTTCYWFGKYLTTGLANGTHIGNTLGIFQPKPG